MSKDTGWKNLKRTSEFNFLKWGEYMKRANIAERKVELLKRLILLTDEYVSHEQVGDLQLRQWNKFITEFPDEANNEN